MRAIDIAVNLADPVFAGIYRSKQVHPSDLRLVVARAQGLVVLGTSPNSAGCYSESVRALELATRFSVYSTAGCHPTRCNEFTDCQGGPDAYFAQLLQLIQQDMASPSPRIVAIGECGLDYDRLHFCPANVQKRFFERQFALAKITGLPLFLHNRASSNDFFDLIRAHRSDFSTGVVHSFDSPAKDMETAIGLGLYIGINGCSMKTAEQINVIAQIPLNRLLIETDAPWCDVRPTHASYQYLAGYNDPYTSVKKERFEMGKTVKGRNEPCNVQYTLVTQANLAHSGTNSQDRQG